MDQQRKGNFESDQHALMTGMVLGLLVRAGINAAPEADDNGDFTNEIVLTLDASDSSLINGEQTLRIAVLPPAGGE